LSFQIISIRKVRKKPRCKLTLDTGDFFNFSIDLVVKHKLRKNQTLSQKELDSIVAEQKIIDCKQTAYYYASYKPRTEKQVREKLKEKGFDKNSIQIAIDFLIEFDLLDDRKFAVNYIRNTLQRKPVGKFKIILNLQKKGIDKDIILGTVEQFYPHQNTLALAERAAEKKMRLLKNKDISKQKNSLISFLKGQGFDWDTIKQLIEKLFADER